MCFRFSAVQTSYRITSILDGVETDHTDGFVSTARCRMQELTAYVAMDMLELNADQIKIYLRAESSHSALNDIKIFAREDPRSTVQHYFSLTPGATWMHETYHNEPANSDHFFDVVRTLLELFISA